MEKSINNEVNLINGSPLFLCIAGISIFNTLTFYFDFNFVIYFGLGITQIIDYLGYKQDILSNKIIFIIISLILSIIFIIINYFSKRNHKVIFWIGFSIYFIDTIIFIYSMDFIAVLGHVLILKLLYDSKE